MSSKIAQRRGDRVPPTSIAKPKPLLPQLRASRASTTRKAMAEKPSHPDALLKAHDFIFGPVMDRVIFSPSGEILEGHGSFKLSLEILHRN
jgi:hypothetical protein